MITIRPFQSTAQEYSALVAIHNAVWPEEVTSSAVIRFRDESWPPAYFFQRLLAERDGQLVGGVRICETHWSYRPGKYDLIISVHPSDQRQGIGTALYNAALQLVEQRSPPLSLLASYTSEEKPDAIRFLTRRGFQQQMRFPSSALQVAGFEPAPFAGAVAKMTQRGIQIATLAELAQRDPDWQRKTWELDVICTQDEPLPDTPTPPTLEHYVTQELGAPNYLPDAWFIALDGEHYVGMSVLNKDLGNPRQLQCGFTAVHPAYRRYGIATALKLRTIAFAQAYGVEQIKTGNEENNPMYQINLRLGFQPRPAGLAFQKEISNHA